DWSLPAEGPEREVEALAALKSHGSRSLPGRDRRGAPAVENVVYEPEFLKPPNDQAIDVDFVPGVRNIGVARKPVMVVVQPFTEGDDRDHQLVGRAVIEFEAAVTVATIAMTERVDQRGGEHHEVGAQQPGEQHAAHHGVEPANRVAN